MYLRDVDVEWNFGYEEVLVLEDIVDVFDYDRKVEFGEGRIIV